MPHYDTELRVKNASAPSRISSDHHFDIYLMVYFKCVIVFDFQRSDTTFSSSIPTLLVCMKCWRLAKEQLWLGMLFNLDVFHHFFQNNIDRWYHRSICSVDEYSQNDFGVHRKKYRDALSTNETYSSGKKRFSIQGHSYANNSKNNLNIIDWKCFYFVQLIAERLRKHANEIVICCIFTCFYFPLNQ